MKMTKKKKGKDKKKKKKSQKSSGIKAAEGFGSPNF